MKTISKKTVLLSAVMLAGLVSASHDFSTALDPNSAQEYHPVTVSDQTYLLRTQLPAGDISIRTPRRFVVVNSTLATLQEGILGNARAEDLKRAAQQYLAMQ